jgi:hypothetical protein
MIHMAPHHGNPGTHLGRQMKRDREAHGLTLRDLAARMRVDFSDLSKIENGKRPMSEGMAVKCDEQFPERRGWYRQYWQESRDWTPPGFRDWGEYEAKARDLVIWCPGMIDGSIQTPDYARAVLEVHPGVSAEQVETRLKVRMQRQQRILREGGPSVVWLVAHVALYTAYGSAEVMAGQCAHVLDVASRTNVTVQVVPAVGHPLNNALVYTADTGAYTEHALGGGVFTEDESVSRLRELVATVRGEAIPVRASLAMIREARQRWTGGNRRTAATVGVRASK